MIDPVAEIMAGLEQLDDVTGVWKMAERRIAAGDAAFVADLAVAIWRQSPGAPSAPWQYRSVFNHLIRLLTLTPGIHTIEQVLRVITTINDPKQQRYVASLLAAGQSTEDLVVIFNRDGPALDPFRTSLLQELAVRGVAVDAIPAMARWASMPDRRNHPRRLPLTLTPLEGTPLLPRHDTRGTSRSRHATRGSAAVASQADPAFVPSGRETTTAAVAAAIAAAAAHWVQESNGRCEARTYELSEAVNDDALAGTLASLGLECLHGTPPALVTCTPEQAWQILFEAAANDGAYSRGQSGAGARQSAWRSIAALTGCAPTTPVSEIEAQARRCLWYTFATTDWFAQDAWDIALVAVTPERRHLAVLAATDTD